MNTAETNYLKIVIVDDHQMFIDGLKLLLEPEANLQIIAEANNGKSALEILEQHQPDLLITDVSMPEMNGIELAKTVKQLYPDIKILVLTMYNDRGIINELLEVEADGYILKNTGKKELLKAIQKISQHGTYYCNEAVSIITERKYPSKLSDEGMLTPREIEIIKLICYEYSSPEIADKLCISPYTVDTHRKNILKKTNTKTVVGLIKFAIEHKIVDFR